MTKRIFDLVLAGVGLVVLSSALLAIAAWVRLDSPGPALFRQERVGRYGRPVRCSSSGRCVDDRRPAGRA